MDKVHSEKELIAVAVTLGAKAISGWSVQEEHLAKSFRPPSSLLVEQTKDQILAGEDPLGEAFCTIRTPEIRREKGATYTPDVIVKSMLQWASKKGTPDRVVDPGLGSARFLAAAGTFFPKTKLVGVDIDPLATIIARANLKVLGFGKRSQVELMDYRSLALKPIRGKTLFIGNPPYVRHHLIEPRWKNWLTLQAETKRLVASQLAGLHVYFFMSTVLNARAGDWGSFITAAEWLDVNYGKLVRDLFLGDLGGQELIVIEPTAMPFPDAATTAAITNFEIGSKPPTIRIARVESLKALGRAKTGKKIRRERIEAESRWSHLTRTAKPIPEGFVELGELCRVHRGQVTGANRIWVTRKTESDLPSSLLFPTVTKAKELFQAGSILTDPAPLKTVIDLPVDLDVLSRDEKKAVEKFLRYAKKEGAHLSYIAQNRRAWWSVGLKTPAPILATYMARRPPAFVRNIAEARHINIAHGIYPREPLSEVQLSGLIAFLRTAVSLTEGRTYAGGLTKFEPREMERILVPAPHLLLSPENVNYAPA